MKRIEILAPAGSLESLYAAINKGCDAVYLGGNKFSARAYASNFDNETMQKAIDYAHCYDVKVYVTINTILKENEIEEAVRYVGYLYEIGVDALIIQDLGLLKRIKEQYADLELHASTQITVHNGEAALYFTEKGFSRIVLSREMSLEEIKYISKDLAIETEMFVHGALCVCYSGQCLMSSIIGGRSGNRGRCAQPCRMEYVLKSESGKEKSGYLLSPKDMCTIEDVKEIIDTGTYSLKIEGRMKRPEYVAGVVDNYRKAVDKVILGNSYNVQKGKRQLLQLFNRSGFTSAFLKSDTGRDMMSYNSPKNAGVLLGTVDKVGTIKLEEDIKLGDGIRVGNSGFTLSKITLNNNEVNEGKIGQTVKLFPVEYKKGEKLYKSLNKELFNELETYIKPFTKKNLIDCSVKFKIGEEIMITIKYNGKEYVHVGDLVEKAEKKPLDKERIVEALQKSGDTPFKINNVSFDVYEEGFVRIATLNNLRREALEKVAKDICKSYRRKRDNINKKLDSNVNERKERKAMDLFTCITKEQLNALIDYKVKNIAIDIFSREKNALRHNDIIKLAEEHKDINFYIKTSSIIKGEFKSICNIIDKLLPYVKGIVTSNVGIISLYKNKVEIIGDYKLNIMNSQALKFYQSEISVPTLSLELNRGEIKSMLKNNNGNVAILAYGKPELMVSEYCPIGSTFGGKNSENKCSVPCSKEKFTLIDRVNEKLRVITDIYCRSFILNPVPINLLDEKQFFEDNNITTIRFDFRDEDYDAVRKVLSIYFNKENFDSKLYTKGNFRRGVE